MQNNFDELIALADENDICVDSQVRGTPLPANRYVMIAAVLVFNSKGNIVLQRIASHKKWGGLLTYSSAGHVSAGETYEQAAIRETQEEIGINVNLDGLIGIVPSYKDNKQIAFHHVFKAFSDGPYNPDPSEIDELDEIRSSDLKRYCQENADAFYPTLLEIIKLL